MKKILSAVAALGLVAGVASVASAADFSVTGKYIVEGYYISNAGDTGGTDTTPVAANAEANSDAFWMHTFQMLPTMKVNDNVTVKSDVRLFKETMWGTSNTAFAATVANPPVTTQGTVAGDASHANGDNLDINKLYMEYNSPIGMITVGRTPAGAWGTAFLDSATAANRIMWRPSMVSAPWDLLLYTEKVTEGTARTVATGDKGDSNTYSANVWYKADNAKAGFAIDHNVNGNQDGGTKTLTSDMYKFEGMYKMNNYSIVGELAHVTGDETATTDWDAWGALVHAAAQFDNLGLHAAYVYASGDDAASTDNEALMAKTKSLGKDFQPLYIFTGDTMGILNHDEKSGLSGSQAVGAADFGVKCYALMADYKVSDRLTLHGAVAVGYADEAPAGWDDDYGVEYNVGAAYKLLDNLTYEAHFGYMAAGGFFEDMNVNMGTGTKDAENITLLSHSLTMNF